MKVENNILEKLDWELVDMGHPTGSPYLKPLPNLEATATFDPYFITQEIFDLINQKQTISYYHDIWEPWFMMSGVGWLYKKKSVLQFQFEGYVESIIPGEMTNSFEIPEATITMKILGLKENEKEKA